MTGLALEGGGARGAFHIGAVKAMMEEGLSFDGIAGTSIGALNGAVIAQGDFDKLESFWQELDFPAIFDLDPKHLQELASYKFNTGNISYLTSKFKDILDQKGIDTMKIREVIAKYVDEEKLRASGVLFGLVTVEIPSMTPRKLYAEDIPEGMLREFLMASANLPIFKNEPIKDKHFIDGSFSDNLPVGMLSDRDFDHIYAVRTTTFGIPKRGRNRNAKITFIEPSDHLGSILNFDREAIRQNITLGYYDAKRVLLGLSGRRYYMQKDISDTDAFALFSNIDPRAVKNMARELKVDDFSSKRSLFEKIIPSLCGSLKIGNRADYAEVITLFADRMASLYGIDRFALYRTTELIGLVKKAAVSPPARKTLLFPSPEKALFYLFTALRA